MHDPIFFWSNLGIAISYYLIPIGLFSIVVSAWNRMTVLFRLTLLQFGFFIISCATGHALEAFDVDHRSVNVWHTITFGVSFLVALQMPTIALHSLSFIREKQRADQRLRYSEAQFHAFLDAPQLLAWLKDKTFKIVYNNKTLVGLYGDLTGTRDRDRNPMLTTEQNDAGVLETGEPSESVEIVPTPEGGSRVWLSYKFPVVVGDDIFVGGLAVEITERERLRQEVDRATADLEQFAYAASHDLRTPLRGISGLLAILERRLVNKLSEEDLPLFLQIQKDCVYATELVNGILEYSRVGRSPVRIETLDVGQLLNEICDRLRETIAELSVDIAWEALPQVEADRTQLTQMFENLIGNAIKYRGDASPVIRIAAATTLSHWVFSVTDNGIGIDPADQERLFQMFQRLHARDEIEGTGVGLATVRKIARRHGGDAWVESQGAGRGSTFKFSIARYLA